MITVGLSDLPEELIEREGFRFLLTAYHRAETELSSPLPKEMDPKTFLLAVNRLALASTLSFVLSTMLVLTRDPRFYCFDADKLNFTHRFPLFVKSVLIAGVIDEGRFPPALHLLEQSAALFFDVIESLFAVPSIAKCRKGFNLVMQSLGGKESFDLADNFIRRFKTMAREIDEVKSAPKPTLDLANLRSQLGEISGKLDAVTQAVGANTRTVANMDRRQQTVLKFVKDAISGFIRLFKPSAPSPSREAAKFALNPANRYRCLERFSEPRRSQIKAVIDYTLKHPVVYEEKHKGDFTLANAARKVWEKESPKWLKFPGSFENFDQLKASCYNLREKADDPFRYAK